MPTVVITDFTFPSLQVEEEILRAAGALLVYGQCKTPAALIPLVRDADAVITQFAPVTAEVISAMTRARGIVRYGVGVDNVDLDAARKRSIPVCNVPDYCTDEVADHTLAFILATTRQVLPNCLKVRSGDWGLATSLAEMRALREQTVGIVGFGRIGREVAARLAAFKCRRLVFDPAVDAAVIRAAGCEAVALDPLLTQADIVTLHCPSCPGTRRLLNATSLARLKRGVVVINLARGDLIDTPALIAALESGQVSAAALDVCDPEPIPGDSPLRALPNVITASHVASASATAVLRLRETAARIAVAALRGEPLSNVVNGVERPEHASSE
jgi:D-3-phosphoglycerate dehydrogenase